jgi:hypothetical protein
MTVLEQVRAPVAVKEFILIVRQVVADKQTIKLYLCTLL